MRLKLATVVGPQLRAAALLAGVLLACGGAPAFGQLAWPEFRGPTGQGVATAENLPLKLDVEAPVWRREIPGKGWSSPVVADGRVILTSAVPDDDGMQHLVVIGVALDNGKLLYQTEVFQHPVVKIHSKNSHASPTPIIRDGRVYVHFGPRGTACLDLNGRVVWKNQDLSYPPVHGNGGSPVLVDDLLVFSADGAKEPFLVALSIDDGSVAWRVNRATSAKKKFSFSTPLAVDVGGRTQLISPGSDMVAALDARSGELIWQVDYAGYSVIPRPVQGHDMVFFSTSYDAPSVLAVRLGGQGNVTDTHVAWKLDKGAPHTPSMILDGDELYMVSDRGVATCVDALTGAEHWRERIGGNFSASPVLAVGRLYLISEQGECSVVAAGKQFKLLAKSDLGQRTLASPAVVGKSILVRTEQNLYRFE